MTADEDLEFFQARGFGKRLGFGERPAVVVIDLISGFTDPAMPLGADLGTQVRATSALLDAARRATVTILYTTVFYEEDMADAGVWHRKSPNLASLKRGTHAVELDPRLERQAHEAIIVKKYASAFFGTDLASRLTSLKIDTVLIAGCTTSGCVRATAVDAIQSGFAPIVVEEAVGDRSDRAHRQSLFDLNQKYADVTSLEAVLAHLAQAAIGYR